MGFGTRNDDAVLIDKVIAAAKMNGSPCCKSASAFGPPAQAVSIGAWLGDPVHQVGSLSS